MINLTNISNHPVVGCKRKAGVYVFRDDRFSKIIEIEVRVFHFNEEDESLDAYIAPRTVFLVAAMDNCVDSNGDYLADCTTGIPEYVYWKDIITSDVLDEETLYTLVITKADINNRFN